MKKLKNMQKIILYICTKNNNINNTIEVPMKYLKLMIQANPKMKYHENKMRNTFIVDSFK